MKVDSSKVSQMVIAESSLTQMREAASSDISRRRNHKENTKSLILEDTALKLESRKETIWSNHVRSTLTKPD